VGREGEQQERGQRAGQGAGAREQDRGQGRGPDRGRDRAGGTGGDREAGGGPGAPGGARGRGRGREAGGRAVGGQRAASFEERSGPPDALDGLVRVPRRRLATPGLSGGGSHPRGSSPPISSFSGPLSSANEGIEKILGEDRTDLLGPRVECSGTGRLVRIDIQGLSIHAQALRSGALTQGLDRSY